MLDYLLLSQVNRYLEGSISLEQLESWVVSRWRQLFALPRSSASELAGAIELGLAEISGGVLSEEEFKHTLAQTVRKLDTVVIPYPPETSIITSSSSHLAGTFILPFTEPVAAVRL